jgi:hypothetical protein
MRNAFAEEMTKVAATDKRVVVLSGDIGNRLFDKLRVVDASRFYNCGVAEANMMGVAAGMALSGLRPFVYTITPFTTTRCFEQIRVDVLLPPCTGCHRWHGFGFVLRRTGAYPPFARGHGHLAYAAWHACACALRFVRVAPGLA